MAWGRKRDEAGGGSQAPSQPAPPGEEIKALPDAPGPGVTTDREARKRLRDAEAELRRLKRRDERARRREERHARALDRRLARIEKARRRSIAPIVGIILGLHGFASAMAIMHLLFPEVGLYEPLVYKPSAHWELVGISYLAAVAGSVAFVSLHPRADFQQRARQGLYVYFSLALITTFVGVLLAVVLEPIEGMDPDWPSALLGLLFVLAGSGIPLPAIHYTAHLRGSTFFLTARYHWIMGTLTAVFVVALVLLPILFLAWQALMTEVGLAMVMAGALGMLFPLPGLVATMVTEAYAERLGGAATSY